jgi:hypothetical protein
VEGVPPICKRDIAELDANNSSRKSTTSRSYSPESVDAMGHGSVRFLVVGAAEVPRRQRPTLPSSLYSPTGFPWSYCGCMYVSSIYEAQLRVM